MNIFVCARSASSQLASCPTHATEIAEDASEVFFHSLFPDDSLSRRNPSGGERALTAQNPTFNACTFVGRPLLPHRTCRT